MLPLRYLLSIIMLPLFTHAQDRQSAEKTMADFYRFYNANQTDSLCKLFHDDLNRSSKASCTWKEFEAHDYTLANYGLIKVYKFLTQTTTKEGENVFLFNAVFRAKGSKLIAFSLKDNKFTSFSIGKGILPASRE